MREFDLVIIGGGPAGYTAAERAAQKGLKTALVEKDKTGGVCLNEGCIPTKALLHASKLFDGIKSGVEFGVKADGVTFDHQTAQQRKIRAVRRLNAGVQAAVKGAGAEIIAGEGKIVGRENGRYLTAVNGETLLSRNVLIATGASAFLPPIQGIQDCIDSGIGITSREALELKEIPKKLLIIGGGAVGLEFASYFRSAGSDVAVVEMASSLAPNMDADCVAVLKKSLIKKGIKIVEGTKLNSVSGNTAVCENADGVFEITADHILFAAGRKPNTQNIGLEAIGLKTEKGAVITDLTMNAGLPNLYAAGDVNGKMMLAHVAVREAEVAVNNMLGLGDSINYDALPAVIYTSPELGSAGLTAEAAEKRGYKIKTVSMPLAYSGRFVAEGGADGIIKIVADADKNTLLGVHIAGPYASEIISSASILIDLQTDIERIKKIVFPHPTVGEIIKEALFAL